MVHIQYICHLNFKEDRFLANNACNLCKKASNAHPLHVALCSLWWYRFWSFKLVHKKQVTILYLSRLERKNHFLMSSYRPKNQRNFFKSFCPSLWEEVEPNKWRHFISLIGGYLTWLYNKVFWFELFLNARAEIL